jgi:transposase
MMGARRVMGEALFYGFSLERHVPDDHLLRKIDRFVDLSEVRAHLEPYYSDLGRPSIDPELMVRMLIVGYGLGIRSERRLCEEVHLNLAYRWFCRLGLDGDVPNHSTFSKNRHGRFRESDLLRKLFETVGGALHEGKDRGRRCLRGRRQHNRGGRALTAKRRQGRRSRSDLQSRSCGISFGAG